MIHVDIILAKIILLINSGSPVDPSIVIPDSELFNTVEQKAELCNAIVIPHKQRYLRCCTEEQKSLEFNNMLMDYRSVFSKSGLVFITEDLLRLYFMFIVAQDFSSPIFRDIYLTLLDHVKQCDVPQVKISILQRMLWVCVRGHLYGQEPFDSILLACTEEYEETSRQYENVVPISFLE